MNDSFLRNSDELSRRRFMNYASKTLLGVSIIPTLLPLAGYAADKKGQPVVTPSPAAPSRKPTARNVIYLYMSGGMTHVDTFDPKPEAGEAVAGPVKAIATKADGIQVSEYLPMIARQMDRMCLIRGLSTTQGAHEQGNYFMHSSYTMRGTIQHPGLGAWIQRLEGRTNRTLPGSVCIGGGANGGGSGFMESKYAPLFIGSPNDGVPNSKAHVGKNEFDDRLMLASKFDTTFHDKYDVKQVRAYTDMYEDAVRLMRSEDLKAFNIGMEDQKIRDEYGNNGFGQGCLLARRLIENDVRHVEVTMGGWDTHTNNFTAVQNLTANLDMAVSALMTDLDRRGLLDETLIVLTTEFGRTPYVNENDGRDHFPKAFSGFMAGGGVKGGQVYGKTNEHATDVVEGKMTPPDFNATIAYGLGLPLDQVILSPSKRPFTIADKGAPVTQIFG